MTHAELVQLAAGWLGKQKRCPVVITELVSAVFEVPDAIGWYSGTSILVECKASRADFLADRDKPFRVIPGRGIGRQRYFMCPAGLIEVSELPERWGLVEVTGAALRVARKAENQPEIYDHGEVNILLSALRRIGQQPPPGISVKCYTIESQNRATIGFAADETACQAG